MKTRTKTKIFWPCYYCGKEVWGSIGKIVRIGRKKHIAHQGCYIKAGR